jgi:hypothetical protein
MRPKAINIFSLILVNAVYTIFFAVQIFFNFDDSFTPKSPASVRAGICSIKKPIHASHKVSFRLNKRFQPRELLVCSSIGAEIPLAWVHSTNLLINAQIFLPVPSCASHPLRGPPIGCQYC